jgi:hypothetical protein
MQTKPHPNVIETWVGATCGSLSYQVDANNPSSSTGMFDWLMINDEVPNDFVRDVLALWDARDTKT